MTDLERHWDDLPVRPAPVDASCVTPIVSSSAPTPWPPGGPSPGRAARCDARPSSAASPPPSSPARSSPSPAPTTRRAPAPATPRTAPARSRSTASCRHRSRATTCSTDYVERGVDLVGAYGWGQPYPYYRDVGVPMPADGELPSALTESTADRVDQAPRIEGSYSSDTGTNVQEAGVDEPDTVKTDGAVLVRLRRRRAHHLRRRGRTSPASTSWARSTSATSTTARSCSTATPWWRSATTAPAPVSRVVSSDSEPVSQTRVVTIDLSDPAAPEVVDTVDYDAAAVTARQHGDVIRLVVNRGLPDLDFVVPIRRSRFPTVRAALRENQRLVRQTTLDDWLPRQRTGDGGYQQFLDCDAVAVPRDELGLGTTAVVGFGADAPAETRGLAAGRRRVARLRVVRPPLPGGASGARAAPSPRTARSPRSLGDTHVYGFALDGPRRQLSRRRRGRGARARPVVDGRAGRRPAARRRADLRDRQLQLDRDAEGAAATGSRRSAGSTGSASARTSRRCGGSRTWRSS